MLRTKSYKLEKCFIFNMSFFPISYPDREQLQAIYSSYLKPILHRQLSRHPVWGNVSKIHALAGSMIQLFEEVKKIYHNWCNGQFFSPRQSFPREGSGQPISSPGKKLSSHSFPREKKIASHFFPRPVSFFPTSDFSTSVIFSARAGEKLCRPTFSPY